MKLLIVLCLVALTVAAPQDAQILRYDVDNNGLGNYRFAFDQSDGTTHEQQGELKNAGRDDEALLVRGKYSWVAPDGVTYVVSYVADENGYQPEVEQPAGRVSAGGVGGSAGRVASLLG